MAGLRELLAKNLKEKRRNRGLTQAELAEKAGVSTHHIGILEIARSFPTLDLVERIAAALDIEIYELFVDPHSPREELEKLRQTIVEEIKQTVAESIAKGFADQCKK
ncbi:MAG: helix-turn-helix domain-containing protein [Treponema sp.]|jgi:transcriptional regulator with XRE-family HTH domain|nr:helix-turn-helix domain-containing protein [Treponema sp.]